MIAGDIVVLDGGEIILENVVDGGEIGSTTAIVPLLQAKTITPSEVEQTVLPDTSSGYFGLSSVTVEAIPSNYGRITWNGHILTVS